MLNIGTRVHGRTSRAIDIHHQPLSLDSKYFEGDFLLTNLTKFDFFLDEDVRFWEGSQNGEKIFVADHDLLIDAVLSSAGLSAEHCFHVTEYTTDTHEIISDIEELEASQEAITALQSMKKSTHNQIVKEHLAECINTIAIEHDELAGQLFEDIGVGDNADFVILENLPCDADQIVIAFNRNGYCAIERRNIPLDLTDLVQA